LLTPRTDFYIHPEPTNTIWSENNFLSTITYLIEGEYLDAINNAGLRKVETTSTKDVFAGAGVKQAPNNSKPWEQTYGL